MSETRSYCSRMSSTSATEGINCTSEVGKVQNQSRMQRRKDWRRAQIRDMRSRLRDRTTLSKKENFQVQSPIVLPKIDTSRGFRSSVLSAPASGLKKSTNSSAKSLPQHGVQLKVKNSSKPDKSHKQVKKKSKTSEVPKPEATKIPPLVPEISEVSINARAVQTGATNHIPKSYVLFIGNLPLNITKEQLMEHFRKTGGVKTVRIPKVKGSENGRGFAYVEFKDRISHGIALRLHHTTLGGKRINVEFTSIGGNNPRRKEKLKQKNKALAKLKKPIST